MSVEAEIRKKNILLVIFFVIILSFSGALLIKNFYFSEKSVVKVDNNITPTNTITISPTPIPTQVVIPPTPTIIKKNLVLLDVPFTVQSPFAEWKDTIQQDACEEASVLMAMHWAKGEAIQSKQAAKEEIYAISNYEKDTYGSSRDTSAKDTGKRIIEGYYRYTNYEVRSISDADEIINELDNGNVVIVPSNGQVLGNPNFTQPGPERHMVVIKGYDRINSQFITNDTGISQGANWRYNKDVLFNAIRDYPTGDHVPIVGEEKAIIVVKN